MKLRVHRTDLLAGTLVESAGNTPEYQCRHNDHWHSGQCGQRKGKISDHKHDGDAN